MTTYKIGDMVMFSTPKGTVKTGSIIDVDTRQIHDEYEDYYKITLENGKIHFVDTYHIISKL